MKKIGLTGGMGSGKSIVSGIFSAFDVPVYHSDHVAKDLMHTDKSLVKSLCRHFGKDIYNSDGTLQNARLAEIVFKNKKSLLLLNSLVHPVVMNDYSQWCLKFTDCPLTIMESAILVETGIYREMDATVCVYAPFDLRVKWIMKRDHLTREQIMQRLENQLSDAAKMQVSDYVIINDHHTSLSRQVLFLINQVVKN